MTPYPSSHRRHYGTRIALTLVWLTLGALAHAAEPARRTFNVPAGEAEKAIKLFSEQARLEVLFPTEIVSGVRTRAVNGELPAREALSRMLAGTGLVAVQDDATGALSVRTGAPEPAAKNAGADPSRAARPIGPAEVAKAGSPSDVLELSPFVVAGGAERGYQAFNTLAGTRINSKLEDLGSSITVVTMQQMLDTAVSDLNDVFLYEASTEGTGNFTQFSANRAGGVGDNVSEDPARANRIRGVGSTGTTGSGVNVAFGNHAMNAKIPVDLYNIDAIEISRGPNSNLFGLGASAGTINLVPSQANLNRATSSVALRFDDWGGHRESLNLNRPIVPGKLAVRIASVHESKGFTRKPSSERIDRVYATITAQPFKSTSVSASFEDYRNFYRRPNSLMPRDTAADWRAAGSPAWDPTTQMVTLANGTKVGPFPFAQDANLPAGLMAGTSVYTRLIANIENNTVQSLSVGRTANPITTGTPSPYTVNSNVRYLETGTALMRNKATLYPLFFQPAVRDKSIYDWSEINYTAPNYGQDKARTWAVDLEQTFLRTPSHLVVGRAGWFRQEFERDNHYFIQTTDTVIYVDVNEKLLDGRPNPNFKRPYDEALGPIAVRTPEISDTQTADLAYQFTPRKFPRWLSWIGPQRFASHWETVRNDTIRYRNAPYVADDHAWVNRANRTAGATLAQRYYLGDSNGQNLDYAPSPIESVAGNYNLSWYNNLTGQWVNEPVRLDLLPFTGSSAGRNEIRTLNATAQSSFFNNRLVTTVGWRNDRRRERTSASNAIDPTTGVASYDALKNWGPWTDDQGDVVRAAQRGKTKTLGAVVKPLSWLNLHYNQSDSFFPQEVLQNLDLVNNIPNSRGEGKDYGFSVTTLEGKLHVRLNRFQVAEYDSRGSEVGTIGNRTFNFEGRVKNNGNRDAYSFYPWAENLARSRFAAQGVGSPSQTQLRPAIAKIMGVTDSWLSTFSDSGNGNPQTVGTTDVTSQGYELEVTYNPTRNWRIKFTGAQAEAFDQAISPEIYNYWQSRMPVWTAARGDLVPGSGDGRGEFWWTTAVSGVSPASAYQSDLISPYLVGVANAGKPRTQVRKYRWATVTNYDFTEGFLKNFNVGGALRWEDKASIGFGGKPAATSGPFAGAVLDLDINKPFWSRARYYMDLSAGYKFRLFSDKIRAKARLNVRNACEGGRLQSVAVNPDGSTYAYRIIDPRQFILSLGFDL